MYSRACALWPMRLARRVGERMIDREAAVSRGSILLVAGTDVHAETLTAVVVEGAVADTDLAERFVLGRLTTRVPFAAAARAIPVRDHAEAFWPQRGQWWAPPRARKNRMHAVQ
jgi:hypothetical protein